MIDVLASATSSGSATLTILSTRTKTQRDWLVSRQAGLLAGDYAAVIQCQTAISCEGGPRDKESARYKATQKTLQTAFCGPSSRRVALQMNLKEQGAQIKTLIMRNDESVLCLRFPTRDCRVKNISQNLFWGRRRPDIWCDNNVRNHSLDTIQLIDPHSMPSGFTKRNLKCNQRRLVDENVGWRIEKIIWFAHLFLGLF